MNDFLKKKLLWIISFLLILLAVWGLIKFDLQQKRTVDGIDLSHHNTVTDWDKVNVKFVYAKATEGKSHKDSKFNSYRRNATKRGIPFGAYHFLSTNVSAKKQFQNFKNVVPKGSTTLIPMLDIEGRLSISNDSLHALVGGWIKECHDYYGVYPLLYFSPSLYKRLMGTPNFWKCQIWFGAIDSRWDMITFHTAKIVQFKMDKVDGIMGRIDCNHLNGSLDDIRM